MLKEMHVWFPGYIKSLTSRRPPRYPVEVLFTIADHFEPAQKEDDPPELQLKRVTEWIERYEERFSRHLDSDGRIPVRTYFFPQEQYRKELLDALAGHCSRGFGEVEIHIHHDGETPDGFVKKIEEFKSRLVSHGLLSRDERDGKIKYGFVHGNWALDNARRDGRWCGLNNEITLLRETGCYADFTLPCAPADGQTRKVNSIYFTVDDPSKPKSHDSGIDIEFGKRAEGDLLLIQGPLALNFCNRKAFFLPRLENGDVSVNNPVTKERIRIWLNQGISVRGKENFIFIKLHSHGLKPRNFEFLLGPEMERAFSILETEFNDGEKYRLHYLTAREMANIVYAFNDGVDGTVESLRDYRLKKIS